MDSIKVWWRATRPWSLTASAIPVILGSALAYAEGSFNVKIFVLTLLAGCLLHLGTNVINTYGDYKAGVDTIESAVTCPELVAGVLDPEKMKQVGIVYFGLATLVGLYLALIGGWPVIILGAIGIIGGYGYTAGIAYKYTGWGSFLVFILMGVLMVCGSFYLQTGYVSIMAILVSLGIGCLVAAILHANEFRDIDHDQQAGITTLAMILGREKSLLVYKGLLVTAVSLLMLMGMVSGSAGVFAVVTIIALFGAIKLWKMANQGYQGNTEAMIFLEMNTAKYHQAYGLVLTLAIIVSSL